MEDLGRRIDIEECMKIHGNYNADSDSDHSEDISELPSIIPYGKVKNIIVPSDTDVRPLVEIHLQSKLNEKQKVERLPELSAWFPTNIKNTSKHVNNKPTYACVAARRENTPSEPASNVKTNASRTGEVKINSQSNTNTIRRDLENLVLPESQYIQKSYLVPTRTYAQPPLSQYYYGEMYNYRPNTPLTSKPKQNDSWCVIL